MKTITVTCKGQEVSFSSPFADPDALRVLIQLVKTDTAPVTIDQTVFYRGYRGNTFAEDLVTKSFKYGASEKRLAWMQKLVTDAMIPLTPKASAVSKNLKAIIDLFDTAAKKLRRPRIVFKIDGQVVHLQRASQNSKYPGDVHVSDGGPFGTNKYFGRITQTGDVVAGRDLNDNVRNILEKLADNPAKTAAEYGHKSGNCCFCNRTLTDARSTFVGYGPVCAGSFGLPWGEGNNEVVKPEQKKEEEVVNTHPWYGSAAEGYSAEMSDLGIQHGQLTVMTPAGEISLGACINAARGAA